jgi:hypothetical protein
MDSGNRKSTSAVIVSDLMRIDHGPKGRGMFATCDIPPRTLLHVAPCIPVTKNEYDSKMQFTVLEHYLFNAPAGDKLLALGYGSLFNHASHPNVDFRVNAQHHLQIVFLTGHKDIRKGEELCISYGSGKLWFDDESSSADSEASISDEEEFLSRISVES